MYIAVTLNRKLVVLLVENEDDRQNALQYLNSCEKNADGYSIILTQHLEDRVDIDSFNQTIQALFKSYQIRMNLEGEDTVSSPLHNKELVTQ